MPETDFDERTANPPADRARSRKREINGRHVAFEVPGDVGHNRRYRQGRLTRRADGVIVRERVRPGLGEETLGPHEEDGTRLLARTPGKPCDLDDTKAGLEGIGRTRLQTRELEDEGDSVEERPDDEETIEPVANTESRANTPAPRKRSGANRADEGDEADPEPSPRAVPRAIGLPGERILHVPSPVAPNAGVSSEGSCDSEGITKKTERGSPGSASPQCSGAKGLSCRRSNLPSASAA